MNNTKKIRSAPRVKNPALLKSKPKSSSKRGKKKQGSQALRSSVSLDFYKPAPRQSTVKPKASLKLTPCALRFAAAIADPFGIAAQGACIPSCPAVNSQKVHAFSRFDATVGTAGVGFIAITPCIASDGVIAFYTAPTFTGSSVALLTANNTLSVGVATVNPANLPYNVSQSSANAGTVPAQVFGRVVSVGVRIWYTGTTLNESGLTYCYVSPTHEPVCEGPGSNLPMLLSTLSAFEQTEISPLTRNQCSISLFPVVRAEMEYGSVATPTAAAAGSETTLAVYPYSAGYPGLNNNYTYSAASLNVGAPVGLIMFTGVVGNTVHVEIIQHIEYTGILTAGRTTRDSADEEGAGHVMAAASIMQMEATNNAGQVVKPTMWSMMHSALVQVGNSALKIAVPAAEKALAALLL